jgi:hypothetical protein
MESYIVRIYRFKKDNPRHLVGIVESVEGERREKRAFVNLDDLWDILNRSRDSDLSIKSVKKTKRTQRGETTGAVYPENSVSNWVDHLPGGGSE